MPNKRFLKLIFKKIDGRRGEGMEEEDGRGEERRVEERGKGKGGE